MLKEEVLEGELLYQFLKQVQPPAGLNDWLYQTQSSLVELQMY
ncbi:hypothetical protein [Scytonema sp. NUACC21]